MATELHVPSPAKINLFLHVVGRRADGYHLLQTVFQFLDFHDQMRFKVTDAPMITLDAGLLQVPYEDNLVIKAAKLLQQRAKTPQGVAISLQKNIPLGGGLGGGSSNAATTLLALNKLWDLAIPTDELAELGLSLGADVPIFIQGQAAFGEGVGEKLQPISLPESWILLLIPPCEVATAKIFSDSQLTHNTPEITIKEFLANGGHNDCEPIARKHFPQIANALDCLNQYAAAKMTGTGSAVFATFEDKEAALKVAAKIPTSFNGILTRGLNYSPLHEAINKINWGVAKR